MNIDSVAKLTILSQVDQYVHDVLNDLTIGRKRAAEILTKRQGTSISEKLVRTYRDRMKGVRETQEDFPRFVEQELPELNTASVMVKKNVPSKSHKVKTSKSIVIMPDVQAPLQDDALVTKFIQFVKDYEPNELAQVGDFTDSTEISRWVRGKKPEFASELQVGLDVSHAILEKIRDVFDGRFRIVRSNHDDRLELYIEGCAPGLASLRALRLESLVGFDEFDVEFIRDEVVELTPGAERPWIMAHGDEGSLNSIAGRTAFNLAKNKFGANVVCGHTHRAGLTSESYGYNGKIRDTRFGLEVGHFMDLTRADYLKKKGVAANWQQAFGILHVHGDKVYPQLVSVDYDGNFSVEGKLY